MALDALLTQNAKKGTGNVEPCIYDTPVLSAYTSNGGETKEIKCNDRVKISSASSC